MQTTRRALASALEKFYACIISSCLKLTNFGFVRSLNSSELHRVLNMAPIFFSMYGVLTAEIQPFLAVYW